MTFKIRSTISTTYGHKEHCKTIDKSIMLGGGKTALQQFNLYATCSLQMKNCLLCCDYCNLTSGCYFTRLRERTEPRVVKSNNQPKIASLDETERSTGGVGNLAPSRCFRLLLP